LEYVDAIDYGIHYPTTVVQFHPFASPRTKPFKRNPTLKTFNDTPRSTFSFDLLSEDTLTGTSAHVVVRFCSKDDSGTTYLTPDCATPEELHYQIDRMIAELEILRIQGMRGFVQAINGLNRKAKKKP
jgi:hypothetical protein